MRGVYEATVKITGVTAAKTLMYLTAPANQVVEIISASVTDANNSTNQQIECCLQLVSSLGTPTATAITPTKTEQGDQAAASTVKGNVTASEPTYSAGVVVGQKGAPSLSGWEYNPSDPAERVIIGGGATWGLRLLGAITSQDTDVVIRFREIG